MELFRVLTAQRGFEFILARFERFQPRHDCPGAAAVLTDRRLVYPNRRAQRTS